MYSWYVIIYQKGMELRNHFGPKSISVNYHCLDSLVRIIEDRKKDKLVTQLSSTSLTLWYYTDIYTLTLGLLTQLMSNNGLAHI